MLDLTHLLTRLACALHWFNPLVWLAGRRMAIERERACDDLVLNSGSKPVDYAEELLGVVADLPHTTFLGASAIAMARPSKLKSRLKAILDATISRRHLTRSCMGLCLLAAICLVLPLASLRPAVSAQEDTEIAESREATTGVVFCNARAGSDLPLSRANAISVIMPARSR